MSQKKMCGHTVNNYRKYCMNLSNDSAPKHLVYVGVTNYNYWKMVTNKYWEEC